MGMEELQSVPQTHWNFETVEEHLRTDYPIITTSATLRDAVDAMSEADVDLLPVVDDGAFVGIVTTTDVLKLDEILDRTATDDD
jgi:CBS domain-containing protein